jgi:hypothetical protein
MSFRIFENVRVTYLLHNIQEKNKENTSLRHKAKAKYLPSQEQSTHRNKHFPEAKKKIFKMVKAKTLRFKGTKRSEGEERDALDEGFIAPWTIKERDRRVQWRATLGELKFSPLRTCISGKLLKRRQLCHLWRLRRRVGRARRQHMNPAVSDLCHPSTLMKSAQEK